jgi:hypothetical protein
MEFKRREKARREEWESKRERGYYNSKSLGGST